MRWTKDDDRSEDVEGVIEKYIGDEPTERSVGDGNDIVCIYDGCI